MCGVMVVTMVTRYRSISGSHALAVARSSKTSNAGQTKNHFLNDILIPGEGWELVGEGYGFTEGTAVNAKG